MLYYEDGDLLTGPYDIICHQTNCQGIMGAGLAKQIADRYPMVEYRNIYYYNHAKHPMLGTILGTRLPDNKVCINLYAQNRFGRKGRYTDYQAFQQCLDRLVNELEDSANEIIAFPYGIGCGLAGGDWSVIEPMLEEFSNKVKNKVIIVKKV